MYTLFNRKFNDSYYTAIKSLALSSIAAWEEEQNINNTEGLLAVWAHLQCFAGGGSSEEYLKLNTILIDNKAEVCALVRDFDIMPGWSQRLERLNTGYLENGENLDAESVVRSGEIFEEILEYHLFLYALNKLEVTDVHEVSYELTRSFYDYCYLFFFVIDEVQLLAEAYESDMISRDALLFAAVSILYELIAEYESCDLAYEDIEPFSEAELGGLLRTIRENITAEREGGDLVALPESASADTVILFPESAAVLQSYCKQFEAEASKYNSLAADAERGAAVVINIVGETWAAEVILNVEAYHNKRDVEIYFEAIAGEVRKPLKGECILYLGDKDYTFTAPILEISYVEFLQEVKACFNASNTVIALSIEGGERVQGQVPNKEGDARGGE